LKLKAPLIPWISSTKLLEGTANKVHCLQRSKETVKVETKDLLIGSILALILTFQQYLRTKGFRPTLESSKTVHHQ
jgi:hypothetical protein